MELHPGIPQGNRPAGVRHLVVTCRSGSCPHTTTILELDLATMGSRIIARLAPTAACSDGPNGLQVRDTIFLKSCRGDALAYMKAPIQ
jgi:hypothetical protein